MGWRLAHSLIHLQNELDARWPKRTTPDWTIGDQRHQSYPSDHNPNNAGVVCAMDIREGNINLRLLADHIASLIGKHPAVKYVIFDRKIAGGWTNGEWTDYNGSNPHTDHIHVSVGNGPDGSSTGPYDSDIPWGIEDVGKKPVSEPEYTKWYRGGRGTRVCYGGAAKYGRWSAGDDVAYIQRFIGKKAGRADGYFGPKTREGVLWYQRMRGLKVDGEVGPQTWRSLKVRYRG